MSLTAHRTLRPLLAPALALTLVFALAFAPGLAAGGKKCMKTQKHKPKAVHKVMAEYPEAAREEKLEGIVVAALSIEADGSVSAVEIREGEEAFHQVTIDALEQWQFEPLPEPASFEVTVRFRLDKEEKAKSKPGVAVSAS